jgi:hypothetical protein
MGLAVAFALAGTLVPWTASGAPIPIATHTPPSSAKTGDEIPLVTSVEPLNTLVISVVVYWGGSPDATTNQLPMVKEDGNSTTWRASIPAQDKAGVVYYFIEISYIFTTTEVLSLPDSQHRYSVTIEGSPFSGVTVGGLVIGGALLLVAVAAFVYAYRKADVMSKRINESEIQRSARIDEEEKAKGGRKEP